MLTFLYQSPVLGQAGSTSIESSSTTNTSVTKKIKKSKKKSKKKYKKRSSRKSKRKKRYKRKKKARKKKSIPKEEVNDVDATHETISRSLFLYTNNIDQFFGGTDADDNANGTRLRLFVEGVQHEHEHPTSRPGMELNIVLPQFQKRMDKTLQDLLGQEDETPSEKKKKKKQARIEKKRYQRNTNPGMMEALYQEARTWRFRVQTGVDVKWPLQTFVKLKAYKTVFYTKWQLKPLQELKWKDLEGWGTRTKLTFDKKLSKKFLERWENEMTWSEESSNLFFINGPSIIHTIDERKALSYNFRVQSENDVGAHFVTNYFASIGYRQKIYKNWVFMSITPKIEYQALNGFRKDTSLTIKFEAVLGSI